MLYNHIMLNEFKTWYSSLRKNKSKDVFSPHKPLTVLYALANIRRGKRWIDYNESGNELDELIWSFTNLRSKPNSLNPLYRLANDAAEIGIWNVYPNDLSTDRSGNIKKTEAIERHFKAGFSDETWDYLQKNQFQVQKLIEEIIDDNFPETLSDDLLLKLGIADLPPLTKNDERITQTIERPRRDPNFPKRILSIYDNRCCFCGLKLYLNDSPLSMEAAHIKWKAQGGECSEGNGLSLCPTHHYTFDRGLWSLDDEYKIFLSSSAIIDTKSDPFFRPFLGKSIADKVMDHQYLPTEENIIWHRKNILKVS